MNEFMPLLFALLGGVFLGVFFFAGLWWTVRKLASAQHVALLFLSSMLLRTGVVLVGFYFIMGDNWQRLLAAVLGFIIARIMVSRLTRITQQSKSLLAQADHES